jgi:asparagine synthase (glutamine-hydrolysing)
MCGISGLLSRSPIEGEPVQRAVMQLRHRGPDDAQIWSDRHIQLGHTRLAILDLSSLGRQPMSYQNERFWITYNGEIYNYLELRHELSELGHSFKSRSDTEVLLAAYAEWGKDCLRRLRGMFAFGIWDSQLNRLFLARDRVGEKPLYYWTNHHSFYFASELKALLALLPIRPALDPGAIDLFMHYQYVPEPRTPLLGVKKLAAAHYLCIDLANWQVEPRRYWSLHQVAPITGDVTEQLRHELDQTLNLTLRSDVPVGIALSGGMDSGGIAALAAPKYKEVLRAFSVGYTGHLPCDERPQAKTLANQLGLPFHEVELNTEDLVDFFPKLTRLMDDPIADIAAYGHFMVMQMAAAEGMKVMLSGIGGDELFWGYDWVIEATRLAHQKQAMCTASNGSQSYDWASNPLIRSPLYARLCNSNKLPKGMRLHLRQWQDYSRMTLSDSEQGIFYNVRQDFQAAWSCRHQLYTPQFLEQLLPHQPFEPFRVVPEHRNDVPLQSCQFLFDTWLASNCLALGDRTSMAASLEVRLPLLDYQLIELVVGLQKQYPHSQVAHKRWLKEALKGILPDEVLDRPKRGFEPPYEAWIQELVRHYGEWVVEGHLVKMGYFNEKWVKKLFQDVRKNYSVSYRLIVLELWYRSVVEDCYSL